MKMSRLMPHLLSALRIVAALLFLMHGTVKLFGYPPGAQRPPLVLASMLGAAGVLETFGGGLMLLGLFTRPVAFVLSGEMAVGLASPSTRPHGQWPDRERQRRTGRSCTASCWLFYVAAGPGPWSLDALRKRRIGQRIDDQRPPRADQHRPHEGPPRWAGDGRLHGAPRRPQRARRSQPDGFVWRLQGGRRNNTYLRPYEETSGSSSTCRYGRRSITCAPMSRGARTPSC